MWNGKGGVKMYMLYFGKTDNGIGFGGRTWGEMDAALFVIVSYLQEWVYEPKYGIILWV